MFQIIGLLLIIIGLGLMIIIQGLRRIPADPPQVALVTFLGKRIGMVKKEGWRFFFGYPYIFGYIPIGITKINQDFVPEEVRTPDNAEIKVPISITWNPDGNDAEALISYINSGTEGGIKNILQDIVSERVRRWARSTKEGPQTWQEAQAAGDEAVKIILETILAKDVSTEELKESRRGNGNFKLPSLGIIIIRLNVEQIEVMGKVAEAAELKAKEEQEREAEIVELEHVQKRTKILTDMGFSKEKALEIVQTERGKVTKTISENQISIPPETREMIKEVVPLLTGPVMKLITNKGGKRLTEKGGKRL